MWVQLEIDEFLDALLQTKDSQAVSGSSSMTRSAADSVPHQMSPVKQFLPETQLYLGNKAADNTSTNDSPRTHSYQPLCNYTMPNDRRSQDLSIVTQMGLPQK